MEISKCNGTDLGITTRGLYVQEYEVLANSVKQYADEIARLKQEISEDPGNTELIDRLRDLEEQQRSNISAMEDQKEALRDLAEEGYNALLDALQKLIDKYKDALQQQKSLYDYEKNISEQNANINSLRKQLLAYDNGRDTTEENKARVQKLNADLKKAEEQLQESEYDRWIQDTEALLDKFMDDFQTWIEQKLLDLDAILREAIEATNLNAETISNTLNTTSDKTGYVLTDEFAKIWANIMSSDSIFSQSFDIESATNQVCTDIKAGVDLLPTMDGLSNYLSGETLSIVNSIASVDNAVNGVQSAIGETNSALAQISSKLTEYNASIRSGIESAKAAAQQAKQAAQQAQSTANQAKSEASAAKSAAQKASTTPTSSSSGNGEQNYFVQIVGYTQGGREDEIGRRDNLTQKQAQSLVDNHIEKQYDRAGKYRNVTARVRHYAKGGLIPKDKNPLDFLAQQLGEDHMVAAKEGERILTAKQNENFEKLANTFSSLSSDELAKYSILTGNKMLSGVPKLQMPTFRDFGQSNSTEINGGISINLPNVTNKEEFVNWLKTDGQIEKIVQAMTLGTLQGKNSYSKMKY